MTNQLIESHLVTGRPLVGNDVGLRVDQTLTQDATGTLVMLELEALGLDRVKTELSAQYVDHNLIQADFKNPDDHLFLRSACLRFGVYFSRPGNGVSHPLHMERFGIPGKVLIGADSHTCAAGALGMLAIGAGGLEVALVMAGETFHMKMPKVWGIQLTGRLKPWVSAKDVILELLRRHGVAGGKNRIIEYFGPGVASLSAMDRHVIANMGAELGATTSVFPSDEQTFKYMLREGRSEDWVEVKSLEDSEYDLVEELNLDAIEPLIAQPSSPGNVVPVHEVRGEKIYQAYIGSSANPGFRDFAIAAEMLNGHRIPSDVSFDINPASREVLTNLIHYGYLEKLISAGARVHQAGCNGCIGMGQAPATGQNSLRTTPRNFPGRSGTLDDLVWLCSPETATASAFHGQITDPRTFNSNYPDIAEPQKWLINTTMIDNPLPIEEASSVQLIKGPNITSLVEIHPIANHFEGNVALVLGDNVSTDEILPGGTNVLPFRSNIQKISEFAFIQVDPAYRERAKQADGAHHVIVAGSNYGQGSSREHAALALVYLGLRIVIAKEFARIHWQNLVNFGVLPLVFEDAADKDKIHLGDSLRIRNIEQQLQSENKKVKIQTSRGHEFVACSELSQRQVEILKAGGLIRYSREKKLT